MNKKTKYAINGSLIGAAIKLLLNGIKQYQRIQEQPEVKFNWKEFLKEGGKGALIGGGTGLVVGAITDEINSTVKPINTDKHLNLVVDKIQLKKNSNEYVAGSKKCNSIISFLENEFSGALAASPYVWGSMVKGTAIKDKSDFDIRAQFKKESYSIEEMYETLHTTFEEKYDDRHLIKIRKQKKSVGVIFEMNGEEVKIDVVPERKRSYKSKDTSTTLYVKRDNIFSNATYQKTDISIQSAQKLSEMQKKLVMVLKKWKSDFEVPLSSYMLELFVKRAYSFNKNQLPKKFTDKLLMTLEYINANIETDPLQSAENTNNLVNNLSEYDCSLVKAKIQDILKDYDYQPNSISKYFNY